jgi:hypothetical protein
MRPSDAAWALGCSQRHVYDLGIRMVNPSPRIAWVRADRLNRAAGAHLSEESFMSHWPTVAETADMLHVSTSMVHQWMSARRLDYRKPHARLALVDPESVVRLVGGAVKH